MLVFLQSCSFFEKRKVDADELLNESLRTFNWNEVDEYPAFATCDSAASKIDRKTCFEETLHSHINSRLSDTLIIVPEAIDDTVLINFQISEKGVLSITEINIDQELDSRIPTLDSLLFHSIEGLPRIYPAIKRGQQVRTQFKIPIVIKAD